MNSSTTLTLVGLYTSSLLLYYSEGCTGLARVASTAIEKPVAGAALQGALNLFSRLGVFLQMPIIGYALDKKLLIDNRGALGLSIIGGIATGLMLSYISRQGILKTFLRITESIATSGSMFNWNEKHHKHEKILTKVSWSLSKSTKIAAISYTFLFSTWPIILIAQKFINDFSALLMSSAAIINGISTILHTMYIEPMVAKRSEKLSDAEGMYAEIMSGRVIAIAIIGLSLITYITIKNLM